MTDAVTRLTAALADRYRLERKLGAGGMTTVYLAEDWRVAVRGLGPSSESVAVVMSLPDQSTKLSTK